MILGMLTRMICNWQLDSSMESKGACRGYGMIG